jgi:signal transduction histidine kinase
MPADSVIALTVGAPGGEEIFRTGDWFHERYAESDTLDPRFGGLVTRLALRPEAAGQLVVGGLPRSRLPMIVGLLLLTAALVVVALLQLRRQQELARLRTDFVSGVSHELRTPLAQIRMFAELLKSGQLRTDAERLRSAEIIDEEAQRLTYLVENVLSFARQEHRPEARAISAHGRVKPDKVSTDRDVQRAVDAFVPLARARRVTVHTELGAQLAACIDPSALRQVLYNLLDNAVKYGPPGQTVVVGMAPAQPRPGVVGKHVRIWVDDCGPGIPEDERDQIWNPFQRLERTLETAVGGSGIGLSIVRDIVEQHGGEIWVEDAPGPGGGPRGAGGGARFVVELPAGDPRAAEVLMVRTPAGGVPV